MTCRPLPVVFRIFDPRSIVCPRLIHARAADEYIVAAKPSAVHASAVDRICVFLALSNVRLTNQRLHPHKSDMAYCC